MSQALVPLETQKFTRVLSKAGTAAKLRQSISEAVRGSMFVVRAWPGRDSTLGLIHYIPSNFCNK
uniref:Uncharacterized protein n=1 Tax=Gopherus agassizii TaxID=38772 RepID=A0A452H8J6_9SAUR